MPITAPEEWIAKLHDAMRNHGLILVAGVAILSLVIYLAVGTTQSLIRALRTRREQAGYASNPVLDKHEDDEPRNVASIDMMMDDSVAFAKRMAEVKTQFNRYNARLDDVSSRYGVDVKEDVLSKQVYSKDDDEYAKPSADDQ